MKPTRRVSDLVAGLRHITVLLEASGLDELPAPTGLRVDLDATFTAPDGVRRRTVDLFAAVTGSDAGYEPGSTKYAGYETLLEEPDQPWQLRASALVRRPDPVAELAAENARLREQLAELTAEREPALTPVDVEPGAAIGVADRCTSGDPWCTPASPCVSCRPADPASPTESAFDTDADAERGAAR